MEQQRKVVPGGGQGGATRDTKDAARLDAGAASKQAFDGYLKGVQGTPAGGDAGSPGGSSGPAGDGLRQMFTTSRTVPGTGETVYLGKWYYRNVTQDQADAYAAHGKDTEGWFLITKTQFEIQNGATNKNGAVTRKADPNAWTYNVRGPGGTTVKREKMNFTGNGEIVNGCLFLPPDKPECDIEIALSPAPGAPCDATIQAMDANGAIRTIGTVHFAAGQSTAVSHYKILPGESLGFQLNLTTSQAMTVSALVKVTSGGGTKKAAIDTMPLYGTQVPSDAIVGTLVKQRK